jgi:hypothetical protein
VGGLAGDLDAGSGGVGLRSEGDGPSCSRCFGGDFLVLVVVMVTLMAVIVFLMVMLDLVIAVLTGVVVILSVTLLVVNFMLILALDLVMVTRWQSSWP